MTFYVYMLTNRPRGVLYVGVTNSLERRVWEHRNGYGAEFAAKYRLRRLVWAESFERVIDAINYEKRIKRWRRAWKIQSIEAVNPRWDDLLPTD
jgi:putative endonuclease